MKICKVRPDRSTCSACIATQEMFNVVDDCGKCKLNTDTYFTQFDIDFNQDKFTNYCRSELVFGAVTTQ